MGCFFGCPVDELHICIRENSLPHLLLWEAASLPTCFSTCNPHSHPGRIGKMSCLFQVCLTAGEGIIEEVWRALAGVVGSVMCRGCNLLPPASESLWLATSFWIFTSDWIPYIVWLLAVMFFKSLLFWMCFIKIEKEFMVSLNALYFYLPRLIKPAVSSSLQIPMLGDLDFLNCPKGKSILWWEPHWWQPSPSSVRRVPVVTSLYILNFCSFYT